MKINNIEIKSDKFAYDGCHKIYLIEDEQDLKEAKELDYYIYDIKLIKEIYNNSCELKFISDWKLTIQIVKQFQTAIFEGI